MTHPNPSLKRYLILINLSIIVFLTACSSMASPDLMGSQAERSSAPGAPAMDMAIEGEAARGYTGASVSLDSSIPQIERIVLKNANLTLVVDDPVNAMDNIAALAEDMGGFVVTANQYQSRLESGIEVPRASITIRVPAEQLEETLIRIQAESNRDPLNKNLESQDVTQEYTDLQSRLRNLEEAEAQLREIMASATRTEDVLNVYGELVEVREQIEVIKGQIQYYEQSAALSAISVELLANEAVQPLTIGSWQPVGIAKDAIQALINTVKFLANAAIWIVLFLIPILLIVYVLFVLPLSLVWRTWRRRRTKRKDPEPPVKPITETKE